MENENTNDFNQTVEEWEYIGDKWDFVNKTYTYKFNLPEEKINSSYPGYFYRVNLTLAAENKHWDGAPYSPIDQFPKYFLDNNTA